MIYAKLAKTENDIKAVKLAMPIHGVDNALCIVGYWRDDVCVGGAYLSADYPNNLVMEFYTHCPTIVKAIGQSYSEMFKLKNQLTAHINEANAKSLKIAKLLGFKTLYKNGSDFIVELHKQNWRYEKRHHIM